MPDQRMRRIHHATGKVWKDLPVEQLEYILQRKKDFIIYFRKFITSSAIPSIACAMLGADKVITREQHQTVFGRNSIEPEILKCPSFEQLQKAARENSEHTNNWHLVYVSNLCFVEQHEIITAKDSAYREDRPYEWWKEAAHRKWAESRPGDPGYQLIDLKPRSKYHHWLRQEKEIEKLGAPYQRADERVVSQLLMLLSDNEVLTNVAHWGRIQVGSNKRLIVGRETGCLFGNKLHEWFDISCKSEDGCHEDLGVYISQKSQNLYLPL